jgi:hypothetical protein
VSGQTAPSRPKVTAQHIETIADRLVRFSGSVRIETDHTVITADEAEGRLTGHADPLEFDLHGNVHVVVNR